MKTKLSFIAGLAGLVAPHFAGACSLPESWDSAGFQVEGAAWQETAVVPDGRFLVLSTFGSGPPDFTEVAAVLHVELHTTAGDEVEGHLAPSPLPGVVLWVPEAPLVPEVGYTLTTRIENAWGDSGARSVDLEVQPTPPAVGETVWSVAAGKLEVEVFGECLESGDDSCGTFCARFESLGMQTRFELNGVVEAPRGGWAEARALRTALGTTPEEALAVLDRTPFARLNDRPNLGGAPYATWPHPEVCAAVEIRDAQGALELREVRCLDLPPDPDLGSAIRDRMEPPPEDTGDSGGEGCTSTPGGGSSPTALFLGLWALAGRWRRRR